MLPKLHFALGLFLTFSNKFVLVITYFGVWIPCINCT